MEVGEEQEKSVCFSNLVSSCHGLSPPSWQQSSHAAACSLLPPFGGLRRRKNYKRLKGQGKGQGGLTHQLWSQEKDRLDLG